MLDNGVTSTEHWRILDAADDLSFGVFYYQGVAPAAGLSYSGAVIGTRTGEWPEDEEVSRRGGGGGGGVGGGGEGVGGCEERGGGRLVVTREGDWW